MDPFEGFHYIFFILCLIHQARREECVIVESASAWRDGLDTTVNAAPTSLAVWPQLGYLSLPSYIAYLHSEILKTVTNLLLNMISKFQ